MLRKSLLRKPALVKTGPAETNLAKTSPAETDAVKTVFVKTGLAETRERSRRQVFTQGRPLLPADGQFRSRQFAGQFQHGFQFLGFDESAGEALRRIGGRRILQSDVIGFFNQPHDLFQRSVVVGNHAFAPSREPFAIDLRNGKSAAIDDVFGPLIGT